MKRLVIDARMINSSGIGKHTAEIVKRLGPRFEIILLANKETKKSVEQIVGVDSILMNSGIYSVSEQLEFPLKIPNCDVYWSPHYNVPVLPIRARKRVVTIHDTYHLAFLDTLNLQQRMYSRVMMKIATRLSDKVVTVSDFSANEITKYTGLERAQIAIIRNGIDTSRYYKVKDPAVLSSVASKYSLPDKFVLFVGNVKPNKNLRNMLQAFEQLCMRFPENPVDLRLVIVGKTEGLRKVDEEVLAEGVARFKHSVSFLGFVPEEELPAIYSMATVFLFPSVYEGSGIPPVEAMACSCPVVASSIPALTETCRDAAYYVDPNSPPDIARGVREVLAQEALQKTLKENGLKRARDLSWEESAKRYGEIFEN